MVDDEEGVDGGQNAQPKGGKPDPKKDDKKAPAKAPAKPGKGGGAEA